MVGYERNFLLAIAIDKTLCIIWFPKFIVIIIIEEARGLGAVKFTGEWGNIINWWVG